LHFRDKCSEDVELPDSNGVIFFNEAACLAGSARHHQIEGDVLSPVLYSLG
jgi:hypothetical protein